MTRHARERMATRNITESELLELVERGSVKYKDATRFWIARYFENRQDNLLSIAAVLEDRIVVKTVMHHFVWEDK
ncbi:DUF4258 domain-containing protein [Halomonas sp. BC1]|nr:DUF4258 domain-containing protein [Halomonas sp. BC1]